MFTYGFYNSLNGDRKYDAVQMSSIFDGIIEDGVYANIGEFFAVVAGTGMSVIVKTGRAWFDHTWSLLDSHLPLDIEESDFLQTRIDAVVLEVDSRIEKRENSIKIVKGIPSVNPVKPTLLHEQGIYQHALAYITINPGAEAILSENIEIVVGKSETPFVQSPLKTVSIDDLFNQWDGEFTTWFDNIKLQLTSNVVTNLQRQIDENKDAIEEVDEKIDVLTTTKLPSITEGMGIGSLFMFSDRYDGTFANGLECNGQYVDCDNYIDLYRLLGVTYGLYPKLDSIDPAYGLPEGYTVLAYDPDSDVLIGFRREIVSHLVVVSLCVCRKGRTPYIYSISSASDYYSEFHVAYVICCNNKLYMPFRLMKSGTPTYRQMSINNLTKELPDVSVTNYGGYPGGSSYPLYTKSYWIIDTSIYKRVGDTLTSSVISYANVDYNYFRSGSTLKWWHFIRNVNQNDDYVYYMLCVETSGYFGTTSGTYRSIYLIKADPQTNIVSNKLRGTVVAKIEDGWYGAFSDSQNPTDEQRRKATLCSNATEYDTNAFIYGDYIYFYYSRGYNAGNFSSIVDTFGTPMFTFDISTPIATTYTPIPVNGVDRSSTFSSFLYFIQYTYDNKEYLLGFPANAAWVDDSTPPTQNCLVIVDGAAYKTNFNVAAKNIWNSNEIIVGNSLYKSIRPGEFRLPTIALEDIRTYIRPFSTSEIGY